MSGMSAQTTLLYAVLQLCTNKRGDHLGNEKSEKNEDCMRKNFENLTDLNKHIITNFKSLRHILHFLSHSPSIASCEWFRRHTEEKLRTENQNN